MPGTYQIVGVDADDPHDIQITVEHRDDALGELGARTYHFDGWPDAEQLDRMMKAENRARVGGKLGDFTQVTAITKREPLAPGAAVPVPDSTS